MASQAQLTANRANAQHSTGPRTEAGKARAAENSTTHGFYSKAFIVREDEQADFDELLSRLTFVLKPENDILCEDLFAQIVHASWNLHRLRILEARAYAASADPFDDEASIRKLELIARHKARFERSRQSALKQYREHATNLNNFISLPYELRHEVSWLTNVHSLHRARRDCTKAFSRESFLTPEQRQQEQAERDARKRQSAAASPGFNPNTLPGTVRARERARQAR